MRPDIYWRTLTSSLTSIRWYFFLLTRPLSFSLQFFVISSLLLGLVVALRFNLVELPRWQAQLTDSFEELSTHYPDDLVVTWDTEQLQLSPAEPVAIQYPTTMDIDTDIFPPLLAYLYPSDIQEDQLDQVLPSRSLLVTTPTQLLVNQASGGWNQLPLDTLPGFEETFIINRQNLPQHITVWRELLESIFSIMAWGSWVVVPVGYLLSRLWLSLFDTLLFYFLLQLNTFKLSFSKAWQVVLHVVVVGSIVELAADWVYTDLTFPILTVTTWLILIYLLLSFKTRLRPVVRVTDQQ